MKLFQDHFIIMWAPSNTRENIMSDTSRVSHEWFCILWSCLALEKTEAIIITLLLKYTHYLICLDKEIAAENTHPIKGRNLQGLRKKVRFVQLQFWSLLTVQSSEKKLYSFFFCSLYFLNQDIDKHLMDGYITKKKLFSLRLVHRLTLTDNGSLQTHDQDHSFGRYFNACGFKDLPRVQVPKAEIIAEVHAPLRQLFNTIIIQLKTPL